MNDLGTFTRHGDAIDATFTRHYPQPVAQVWAALTEPARLAKWMGPSEVDPRVGGAIRMMIGSDGAMEGVIRVFDAPRVLEFTWSNRDCARGLIRYTLTPEAGGTRLDFAHEGMPYVSSVLMLPGWHVLFSALAAELAGGAPTEPWTAWKEMQGTYLAAYGLEGAARTH